jgi:hypothetical protein
VDIPLTSEKQHCGRDAEEDGEAQQATRDRQRRAELFPIPECAREEHDRRSGDEQDKPDEEQEQPHITGASGIRCSVKSGKGNHAKRNHPGGDMSKPNKPLSPPVASSRPNDERRLIFHDSILAGGRAPAPP